MISWEPECQDSECEAAISANSQSRLKSSPLRRPRAERVKGMNNSGTHDQRFAKMTFASVYPLYLAKVEKKGRTKEELQQVITWLTGFDNKKLLELIKEKVSFETFFQQATINSKAHLITGMI